MSSTAAIVLIGNELLSGKIRDENAAYLIDRLRRLGVQLVRVTMVPDEPDAIIDEIRRVQPMVDHVFTSGGVGPTHDDITLQTIAAAFDVALVRNARLEGLLTKHFGERLRPGHLRMADIPEGSVLLWDTGPMRWPVYTFRNIYILPGVPEIFRSKFDAIAPRFADGAFYLRSVYLQADEGQIAQTLADVEQKFGVQIGSYPRLGHAEYKVRVTIEAREPAPVDAAVEALLTALPDAQVVRVSPAQAAESTPAVEVV
jgi:molybdenum cofactor synthesis domain-containing protein